MIEINNRTRDLVGERFSRGIVVSRAGSYRNQRQWKLVCDCGKEYFSLTKYLTHSEVRSCGCLRDEMLGGLKRLPNGQASKNRLYLNYKVSARVKGVEFSLDKDEFMKLTSSNCTYCGDEPSQIVHKNSGTYTYTGIDRIDCTKGYTPDNVIPCCWMCNKAKSDYTQEQFIEWLKRISKYWANK
jgi:5-methylcytosine-specific restriction endonuclease McrA